MVEINTLTITMALIANLLSLVKEFETLMATKIFCLVPQGMTLMTGKHHPFVKVCLAEVAVEVSATTHKLLVLAVSVLTKKKSVKNPPLLSEIK